MLSDADELRHLAMVVLEKRVSGPYVGEHVRQTQASTGEEFSAATRLAAREISPRRPGLSPTEVAADLVRRADETDAGRPCSN